MPFVPRGMEIIREAGHLISRSPGQVLHTLTGFKCCDGQGGRPKSTFLMAFLFRWLQEAREINAVFGGSAQGVPIALGPLVLDDALGLGLEDGRFLGGR